MGLYTTLHLAYIHSHTEHSTYVFMLTGVLVDPKDVVIPAEVCQMIERVLQDLNITPIVQVWSLWSGAYKLLQ